MKKPIIKNWIKYWTTTIAVSGMLALGACDSNNANNTADNVETATEETVTSTRENVNQGMENLETETETENEQVLASDEEETETPEVNQTQFERTSNTNISSERSASSISNMDAHLEEHEEANEAIKEELTDANLSESESGNAGTTMQGAQMNQQSSPDSPQNTSFDQQEDTQMNQQGTSMEQGNQEGTMDQQGVQPTPGTTYYQQSGAEQDADESQQDMRAKSDTERVPGNTNISNNQGGNNYGNGTQDNNTELGGTENSGTSQSELNDDSGMSQPGTTGSQDGTSGNMNSQQGTPTGNQNMQGQDQAVEYETNRQGTTEMSIQNDNMGTQQGNDLDTRESGTENDAQQGTQPGTMYDSQGESYNSEGTNTDQESASDMYTPEDSQLNPNSNQGSDMNSQGTTPSQGQNSMDNQQNDTGAQQRTFDQQGETNSATPGTSGMSGEGNTMSNQSNSEMNSRAAEDQALVIERYTMIYAEDMSDEDRQRMEGISRDYNERRESMRGQINDETGAYVSPEVDAQPTVGYEQLMNQIQENIEYPRDAVAAEMEGTVYVNFVVDENGNVTEAKAYEDVIVPASSLESATTPLNPNNFSDQEIDELRKEMRKEAERAVEETSGMWEAGKQDGQSVKTELQLPVRFDINIVGASGTDR